MINATLFSDPACPWAYSASPALRVIEWRYGDQIEWRLITIGLTEHADQYASRGYTPVRQARGKLSFRRFGMPFATDVKERLSGTARGCRAIVAARLLAPGSDWAVYRALQLANFTTGLLLDDDEQIRAVLATVKGVDADGVLAAMDSEEVSAAYEADKAASRTAAGSPTEMQGKAGNTDGAVRYTAPSVIFQFGGLRLEAGGFQTVEAYDVLIANLDPTLERRDAPETPEPLLAAFPGGLTTQEVAACMTRSNDAVEREAAEAALIDLLAEGRATRVTLGDDALWRAA
ncbi:MAG TPA: DsbA family protein [Solirubrobacteraceae bacterium]|nr:DsbA family protein [Solirubrobacteraceae bacterium]